MGVTMSLQGSLEMFPVNEVLRMLVRSTRAAALAVETDEGHGAIHVAGGSVLSAEFAPVVGMVEALCIRGLVTDDAVGPLREGRRTVLEAVDEAREPEARHLIAERSVESLYRIGQAGGGTFRVEVDRSPPVPSGFTFDLGELTDLASLRAEEWSNLLTVLGDRARQFDLCGPAPGTDEIVLSDGSWRLACVLGEAPTIRAAAAALGATEYEVARELAQLVRAGLAEASAGLPETVPTEHVSNDAPEAPPDPSQGGWWQEPEREKPADSADDEPTPSQDGWWEDPDPKDEDAEPEADETIEQETDDDSGLGLGRRSMGAFARRVLDA
jgi:hypothetical protein